MSREEILNRHKRRWNEGYTCKDATLSEGIENFENIVDNFENPTVHQVEYTIPCETNINNRLSTNVIISDITRNDSNSQDDKLLHTKLSSQLDSGSYLWWSNEVWIVSNEESNAVESHRTYVIRRCSTNVNIKFKGVIYRYPVAIDNLTLYGDGLAQNVDITTPDGKRSIMIVNNNITSNLNIMSRVMVGKKTVFQISMIDDFTNEGLYSMTLIQVAFNSKDDKENSIAYNDFAEEDQVKGIIGDDYIYLSGTNIYSYEGATGWSCDLGEVEILADGRCKLKCTTNANDIGKKITLTVNEEVSKEIKIRGLF